MGCELKGASAETDTALGEESSQVGKVHSVDINIVSISGCCDKSSSAVAIMKLE